MRNDTSILFRKLKNLSFEDPDITHLHDPSYSDVSRNVIEINMKIFDLTKVGKNVLFVCYYGGHGV